MYKIWTLDNFCLSPLSCLTSALGTVGEKAQNLWLRLGAGENPAASSFIDSRGALFVPSILIPLFPSKHVLQVAVPDWLSLFASSISRLIGRLQFGPHVEVASRVVQPHSLFTGICVEAATTLSLRLATPPTLLVIKSLSHVFIPVDLEPK